LSVGTKHYRKTLPIIFSKIKAALGNVPGKIAEVPLRLQIYLQLESSFLSTDMGKMFNLL
jgi:hypothetical protein